MKLSQYAKQVGISYRTAWNWYKSGKIKGYQVGDTIIITELETESKPVVGETVIYARVSSAENRDNLNSQAERLQQYCAARGYQVTQVVKEIGSGVNDNRPKLLNLLSNGNVGVIVVEHKDRLTRFGFNYIETLLNQAGRQIEIVNMRDNETTDLVEDLVAIIYSFCVRLYGQGRAKRKTERMTAELKRDDDATG